MTNNPNRSEEIDDTQQEFDYCCTECHFSFKARIGDKCPDCGAGCLA